MIWTAATWQLSNRLKDDAPGGPLVHEVHARNRGYPAMPFVAVIEAYVPRSLRDLGLSKATIRRAAREVRDAFDTPYALASKRIVAEEFDLSPAIVESICRVTA